MNKRGNFIISVVMWIIVICLIFILSITGIKWEENSGNQIGYISTIDHNGMIFKTYSLYIKPTMESSQEERYCIENEQLKNQIEDAMDKNLKIKIYYYDWFARPLGICKDEDLDIVYKFEILEIK